jgi:hypothetical protein
MTSVARTALLGLLWLAFGSAMFAGPFTIESQVQDQTVWQLTAYLNVDPVQDLLSFCTTYINVLSIPEPGEIVLEAAILPEEPRIKADPYLVSVSLFE